ncbi:MAG: hypothetical protein MUF18_21710 [Fimbriiglobus sp.]|jgi:predicted small lipoprotein YifL|nr:hypothetical protein [Fimbriiglobus sp.]
MKRFLLLAVLVAAVASLTGCGGDGGIAQPTAFAPPPDPKDKSLKGDTLPGPP